MPAESRLALFHPAINFSGVPLCRHLPVDNDCVELTGRDAGLHTIDIQNGGDLSSSPGKHVALELEHGLFVLYQKQAALDRRFTKRQGDG